MLVAGVGQSSLDYLLCVDRYPDVDTKTETLQWHEQCGGPVATALVTLSRLGVECRFFGLTGDDYAGEKIARSLAKEHIDVRGLKQRKGETSQIAFIVVDNETAKRTIFWKRPSGAPLDASELGDDFLEDTDFLLLDGLMEEVSLFSAKEAKKRAIPVMLDAGRNRPGMIEIAGLSDYVVASEQFAQDLGWALSRDTLLEEKQKLGATILTVTSGEKGSFTIADNMFYYTPAFDIRAVDTTGAGDVFHGAYIYGLLQRWSIEETLVFASAVAAMKCTKMGGQEGIPGKKEVERFLRERGHSIPGSDSDSLTKKKMVHRS